MKRYVVHCDRWTQIPGQNHRRTAVPFREALVEVDHALAGNNRDDVARLYPEGTRGWLHEGREVVSFRRRGLDLVPQIRRNRAEASR